MDKKIFDEILDSFENDDIREAAKECLNEKAPPYWYTVAASSTGKYHPDYALGEGGLVRHTCALVRILNYIFNIESIREQFTSRERDLLRLAGIVHDMMKSGTQEDYEKSKWTRFDHPILAARMVQEINGLDKAEKIFVGKAVATHMGQFNTDKRHPDITLPKPQDKYQILLHLCDYLASRKDIEIKFDDMPEVNKEPEPLPDINEWRFTFGKYNGKTIPEVQAIDPQYIAWAKANMEKEPARSLLKQI